MEETKKQINELVIATHNQGKVKEISNLLSPYISSFVASGDLGLSEPVEDGKTFEENAIIKAKSAALESGKVALADDSGLSVTALNGAPGIYSARWAGEEKDFVKAMQRVESELGNAADRSAAFHCVLALAFPDGDIKTFEGKVAGEIIYPARGEKGFGFDPVFQPNGYDLTFAEMPLVEKQKISHRARAFQKMIKELFE